MARVDYFGLHRCRLAAWMQQVCSSVGDTGSGTRARYHTTDAHGFHAKSAYYLVITAIILSPIFSSYTFLLSLQCIRNGIQYTTITISIEADIQKKGTELFG